MKCNIYSRYNCFNDLMAARRDIIYNTELVLIFEYRLNEPNPYFGPSRMDVKSS